MNTIAHEGEANGRKKPFDNDDKCTSHERVRKSPSEFKKLKRIELELNDSEKLQKVYDDHRYFESSTNRDFN